MKPHSHIHSEELSENEWLFIYPCSHRILAAFPDSVPQSDVEEQASVCPCCNKYHAFCDDAEDGPLWWARLETIH